MVTHVLVTGASSGIGRAVAFDLLARGLHVTAALRRVSERRSLFSDALAAHGDRLRLVELDVTDPDACARAAAAAAASGVDALVNNAGYMLLGAAENTSEEELRAQLETNLLGPWRLTKALLPRLREASGAVVFVSSIMGRVGFPTSSGYCTSKFALEGLAESLFWELKPQGVRVALVEPGSHRTRIAANARWASGDVAAYRAQTKNHREILARLSDPARKGRDPGHVAQVVARALLGRGGRLRHPVGPDVQFASALSKLPDAVEQGVWGRFFARTFSRRPPALAERTKAVGELQP